MNLTGKRALITGGAKRLGRDMTLALGSRGASLLVHYHRSEKEAGELQQICRSKGFPCELVPCDLGSEKSRGNLIEKLKQNPPDILVNSASVFPENSIWDWKEEDLNRDMSLHLTAARDLAGLFRNRPGAIVNLLDCRIQDYDAGHSSYHFSKKALYQLTRMLAAELAPETRVNAIAPGLILPPEGENTSYLERLKETNPLQRYGNPEDISRALLFLLESDFVTGQVIYVDGGRNLKGAFYG